MLYSRGNGVPQDRAKAAGWYRKAALQGLADAQYNLGTFYEQGVGVPQDYTQAADLYRRAAEQGNASAQFNLGLLYDNGTGIERDYTQAAAWYTKAAGREYRAPNSILVQCMPVGRDCPGISLKHISGSISLPTSGTALASKKPFAPATWSLNDLLRRTS